MRDSAKASEPSVSLTIDLDRNQDTLFENLHSAQPDVRNVPTNGWLLSRFAVKGNYTITLKLKKLHATEAILS
jgi:hypothetical protein